MKDKKIQASATLLGVLILFGIAIISNSHSSILNVASAAVTGCANNQTFTLDEIHTQVNEGHIIIYTDFDLVNYKVTAKVVNNAGCAFPASFADYKMFDQKLSTQEFYRGSTTKMIAPGITQIFTLDLPVCMTQADFYYGDAPRVLYDDNRAGVYTLEGRIDQDTGYSYFDAAGNFCVHDQPIQVSCVADKATANIGDAVTYTSHVTGGNGTYTYAWTGTDGLSSASQNATKTYSSSGAKNATLTVTSNGISASANCGTAVAQPQIPDLIGSCQPSSSQVHVGESVTWNASASGGNGTYTYSWGDQWSFFESAHSRTESYDTPGTKTNSVIINSGSQSITKTCSVEVVQNTQINNLVGSCTLDNSNLKTGDTAVWRANASGGSGNYTYNWNGDENLNGSGSSVYKIYNSNGLKNASIRITDSSGQSVTSNCSVNIASQTYTNNNLQISCQANPTTANVGQTVTWSANASGGNGGYSYSWSGDHGLTGNNISQSGTYDTAGIKNATVRVTSNDGESQTANCQMQINQPQSAVTVYTNTDNTTPVSQVYLSQVPYTGPLDNFKMALYIVSFLVWSGAVSYLILRRKYGNGAFAAVTAQAGAIKDEFSEKLSSLRTLRTKKISAETEKTEQAQALRNEMLHKLWDRTN
jgi:plastocyanin